ncbi:MAG TPA: hypothetical protein VJS91_04910 [Nitrososphaeraceae archaeon]|nr:hypothetical protein [Nitrososphaeraceae archaeon]
MPPSKFVSIINAGWFQITMAIRNKKKCINEDCSIDLSTNSSIDEIS